jgi:hypothetical protein
LLVQKTLTVGVPDRKIYNVLFLYTFQWFILPELAITADDIYLLGALLTQDEAIHFECLKFITDPSHDQGLLPEGNNSGAVFMGMAHSGSPSLHAILKESPSEDDSTLINGESSDFPIPRECNMVTSAIPIATMPPPEETPTLQTIPAVQQWTTVPQPDTRLLPE